MANFSRICHTDHLRFIVSAVRTVETSIWTYFNYLLFHAHSAGLIVSGSEDGFAKIWRDGVCVQSIEHPGCVWDAKFLENGDVVTACSDGFVRIWTTHNDRIADPVDIETFTT